MATETNQEKSKDRPFIKWLNKAGQSWKDFWDKPVTVQYAYSPHAVVGNGGTPFSTTQRRGDFATLTAAAVAIPATAAGVATVGVVPTLVGMGVGIGAGAAGSAGGSKLIELVGGDENAQEMVGDIAGFTLGAIAGGKATKTYNYYSNLLKYGLSPKSIYTSMSEAMTPVKTSSAGIWTNRGTRAATISEAEKLGIPKGDRGNLSASQQEAVRDLYHYITNGKFRLNFLYDPEKGLFYFGTKTPTTPSGLQTMLNVPEKARTVRAWSDKEGIAWIRTNLTDGALSYFPETNSTNFTAKMPKYEFPGHWGEASARSRGGFDKEIILTAPKTDAQEYVADLLSSNNADDVLLGQKMQLTLSNTIDKNTVGTFYKQLTNTSKPGTYVSGDVSDYPLGYKAITSYAKGNSSKAISDILSGEIAPQTVPSRTGLSPDSYISLLRLSQRPEWNLSFNRKAGFGKWNDSAVHNQHIYDAWQAARNGTLELKLSYIQLFNDWVAPYGGAKAYINDKGIIIHPHPFIVRQKSGGSIHIKKKNKGKFTDYCGGKVTEECIRKGKNSSNPTTRKRANFAANARKWKHREGGKINYFTIF